MSNANDIRNELKELNSPLADMSRAMPYEVPQGYFEGLGQHLTDYTKWAHLPDPITNWSKVMPYEVPQGYFESFPSLMMNIAGEPVLSFGKASPHIVPEGYFDRLPEELLQKVRPEEKPKTKTITLGGTIWKNVRWAAAAVLLLSIGVGVYRTYNVTPVSFNPQTELAGLSRDSINAYVQQHIDEYDVEMLASNLGPGDVKTMTSKLSDEEIQSYLDETGGLEESTMNL